MKIDPEDRIGGTDDGGSKTIWFAIAGVVLLVGAVGAFVFKDNLLEMVALYDGATKPYAVVYEHLEIEPLPKTATRTGTLKRTLNLLKREKCDTAALFEFTQALGKQGYRRAAATALITFSRKCGTSETALARAYKLFSLPINRPPNRRPSNRQRRRPRPAREPAACARSQNASAPCRKR